MTQEIFSLQQFLGYMYGDGEVSFYELTNTQTRHLLQINFLTIEPTAQETPVDLFTPPFVQAVSSCKENFTLRFYSPWPGKWSHSTLVLGNFMKWKIKTHLSWWINEFKGHQQVSIAQVEQANMPISENSHFGWLKK